jgi:uncharacterized membrane protein HdeD (DUF308 family)
MSTPASTSASAPDPRVLWWIGSLVGVGTFGVGVFLVVSPHETLRVLTVVMGVLLLVDGTFAVLGAIVGASENRGLLAIVGVLGMIAGLVLVKKPFDTLVVLTLVLGVWFVVAGVVRLVTAFAMIGSKAATIFAALVDLVAGVLILSWPELGLATFAVIVGIVLIVRGVLLMYAGWLLRKLDQSESQDPLSPALA